jgi:hypothetical protein
MASNCEQDLEHCLVIFLEGSVPIKERCLGGVKDRPFRTEDSQVL